MAGNEDDNKVNSTAVEGGQNVPSKNRRARNKMILALILGLVAIIWVVTMLKLTTGAS